MKILISDAFDPSLPAKLEVFGEVTRDKEQLEDVDVVLVRSKTKCQRDYIDRARKLRLIIRGGVGLDNIDVEYARARGIQVFNTAEASAVAVAELAFALMISVPTRLVEGHLGMRDKEWLKKQLKRTELMGKTLGLIGAGNIGTELARRAIAFGMRVIAYDPFLKSHEAVDLVSMDELLAAVDAVMIESVDGRPHLRQARQAADDLLDRERHLLLDLQRRQGQGRRVDLHLHRRRVRERIHREVEQGVDPRPHQQGHQDQNEPPVA